MDAVNFCQDTIKLLKLACDLLKGSTKRKFMAETTNSLGSGGQRKAAKLFGWCRDTIRKGQHEVGGAIESVT